MRTDRTTDESDAPSFPLLSTKLHRPPIPTGSILRQRLHEILDQMLHEQLEARATPREIAALHVHASEWFEGQGFIDESLKHALAAEAVDLAVQLVARHWHAMLDADRWYVLDHCLSLMPESVIQQHAELLMVRAWLLMQCPRLVRLYARANPSAAR